MAELQQLMTCPLAGKGNQGKKTHENIFNKTAKLLLILMQVKNMQRYIQPSQCTDITINGKQSSEQAPPGMGTSKRRRKGKLPPLYCA